MSTATVPADAALPFQAPSGFVPSKPDFMRANAGSNILGYGFDIPSDPAKRFIGSTINVSIFDQFPTGTSATTPPAALGQALINRSGFTAAKVGGREVGKLADYVVVSGKELGMPDRRSTMYVFAAGAVVVEVIAEVPDESQVQKVIASFDGSGAAKVIASHRDSTPAGGAR